MTRPLVAVSTGLLQNMSRDEAEAVIAHEISHIANGDMVTMTLIEGVVNTFVIFISRILAQIAAGFMGGNRDEGEESNGNPLIYFAVSMVLELVFGIWQASLPCGSPVIVSSTPMRVPRNWWVVRR